MVSDELTGLCPITNQPDFYTATIEYRPRGALPRVEVAQDLPLPLPRPGCVLRGARGADPRRGRGRARAARRRGAREAGAEGARRDHDHRLGLSLRRIGRAAHCRRPPGVGMISRTPQMRQLLLGLILLALGVPAGARADVRVSAFYYPWYGTPPHDGSYQHWSQHGHVPPDDIASAYYPARGLYSSADRLVVGAQMDEIRERRHRRDHRLLVGPRLARGLAARRWSSARRARDGIAVAAHLEPYPGRTVASTRRRRRLPAPLRDPDVLRLPPARPAGRRLGSRTPALHAGGIDAVRADGARRCRGRGRLRRRLHVRHRHLRRQHVRAGSAARRTPRHLLCAPSVGPGLRRAARQRRPAVKPRRHGATYDAMWRAAIRRTPTASRSRRTTSGTRARRSSRARRRPARPLPLLLLRRRLGPARRGGRGRLPRADALLGRTSSAARRCCSRRPRPRRRPPRRRRAAADGRGRRRRPATSSRPSAAAPSSRADRRAARRLETRRACPSGGGRFLRARAAPRAGRCARSSRSRCTARCPRWQTRATGRKPSPRFASVVGHTQIARAGIAEQVELVAVGVRRVHDRRARAEAALAGEQLDRPQAVLGEALLDLAWLLVGVDVQRQAVLGGVRAELAQRVRRGTRGRSGGRPRPRSRRRGVSRARGGTRRPTPGGSGGCRPAGSTRRGRRTRSRPRRPPRPRRAPRRGRGSGTRRPRCSRSRAARGRPRRTRAGSPSTVIDSASAIISSRQAQKSPPSARPRSARWNAWQWASTKPGIVSVGTAVSCQHDPGAQLPNALTIARLVLIPVYAVLISTCDGGRSWPAAIVFGVAGVTDQIDGFLARRWHVESAFGKYRRPARRPADDRRRRHPAWSRRPAAVGRAADPGAATSSLLVGTPLVLGRGYEFQVNLLGKAATWLLYASLGFVMVTHEGTTGRSGSSGPASRSRSSRSREVRTEGAQRRCVRMKAVVMAGGEGTRLRPLTSNQPKPMVPIVGKPCMEHILELLREHGFNDVVVTRRVPAAGDPLLLRRRREPRAEHRVLGRGEPARHRRLGAARERPARRHVPRHLRRRALRHRPRQLVEFHRRRAPP